MMPALPSVPIPPFVASLFAHFPLVTYPAQSSPSASTSFTAGASSSIDAPTLWLLGPPSTPASKRETLSSTTAAAPGEQLSLDPLCRQQQTWARFNQRVISVRWWSNANGALVVGGSAASAASKAKGKAPRTSLPCLHLPNGDLLDRAETGKWLAQSKAGEKEGTAEEGTEGGDDLLPTLHAYTALLTTALLPAILAALYLSSASSSSTFAVVPSTALPLLSSAADYFASMGQTKDRIDEIQALRLSGGRATGSRNEVLDLEVVEREGVECIAVLEEKVKAEGIPGWFGGASSPSQLDALLYSLLTIALSLPRSSSQAQLREKLEASPSLMSWIEMKS